VPELPEVETARRRAERALRGRRIAAVATAPDPIVYRGVTPSRFAATLRGRRVLAVRRKGKHLWMELDRRPWPLFQSLFAGVGNWIADEALYQAAIDPRRPASSLAPREVARLRARLHAIVRPHHGLRPVTPAPGSPCVPCAR